MAFFLIKIKDVIKDWRVFIIWLMCIYLWSMIGMFVSEFNTFYMNNIIHTIWNFTWWFVVTIFTVGYGDISPKTVPGQFIAMCDMVFGIGLMTAAIGKGVNQFLSRREKKLKGERSYKALKNHIVILGGGKLEKLQSIIRQIRTDGINKITDIILVSDAYEVCPLEDEVLYVKGKISSKDCLKRSAVINAEKVIIYGYTDEETIMTTISVNSIRSGDIAVYIRDRDNYKYINHLNENMTNKSLTKISIVGRCIDMLLAQEVVDHGIVEVHNHLIANEGNTYYSFKYSGERLVVEDIKNVIKDVYNGIFIGVRPPMLDIIINPDDRFVVQSGDIVYLISTERPNFNGD